jgi:hypothetical protein
MSATRQRLPDRRASETFTVECSGLQDTATISRFDDGPVGVALDFCVMLREF